MLRKIDELQKIIGSLYERCEQDPAGWHSYRMALFTELISAQLNEIIALLSAQSKDAAEQTPED